MSRAVQAQHRWEQSGFSSNQNWLASHILNMCLLSTHQDTSHSKERLANFLPQSYHSALGSCAHGHSDSTEGMRMKYTVTVCCCCCCFPPKESRNENKSCCDLHRFYQWIRLKSQAVGKHVQKDAVQEAPPLEYTGPPSSRAGKGPCTNKVSPIQCVLKCTIWSQSTLIFPKMHNVELFIFYLKSVITYK